MLGDFGMDPSSQGDVLTKLNRFGSEAAVSLFESSNSRTTIMKSSHRFSLLATAYKISLWRTPHHIVDKYQSQSAVGLGG